jgi:hypothetical protein
MFILIILYINQNRTEAVSMHNNIVVKSTMSTPSRSSLGILLASALGVFASSSASAASQSEVHYHPRAQEATSEEAQVDCSAGDDSCYWNDNGTEDDPSDLSEKHEQDGSHKQHHNHTFKDRGDSGLKQATKDTDGSAEDEQLLQWLSEKAVPEASACGVYLAPSTIPGAGLGLFAGHAYEPNDVVTKGDIIISLSELDWHNGFELYFFLW